MERYYKNISDFLIRNKNIASQDRELYIYAIKIFIQGLISLVLILLVGVALDMFKECMCFISVFIVLRKFTGGVHAKKYSSCLISSVGLTATSLFLIKFLIKLPLQVPFLCILVTSIIVICLLSPIANINKPISKKEKIIYKCISIILSLIFLLVTIFFIKTESLFSYSYSCGMALISVAVLIFIAFLKEKFICRYKGYAS